MKKFFIVMGMVAFLSEQAKAQSIKGFLIDSPACSVKVYRKPTGTIDTLYDKANVNGLWIVNPVQFEPPAQDGETLYVYGGWNLDGKAKTFVIRGNEDIALDLNLNKFTANVRDVIDTFDVSNTIPLKCIYWISGVPPETTIIDTNQGGTFYFDIHVPFDTLQAQHGIAGTLRLEKIISSDTLLRTDTPFTVDRTRFDAQLVADTVYFPSEVIPLGEEDDWPGKGKENNKKTIEFNVYPSITSSKIKIYGTKGFSIYNALGQKIEGRKNINRVYFLNGPNGVYFLRPKEKHLPTIKIIKRN